MIDHGYGVSLGPIDRSHNEKLRTWRNHYSIWKWCRQNDVISDADQLRWFDEQSKDPSIRMYLINDDMENRPVGVCGLTSVDLINRRAEFSLYIGKEFHGQGYGKKALKTLLAHGFKTIGLNGIWGETFDGNPAAAMFEELGFMKEGTRRDHYFREGRFIDAHLYSILRSDWDRKFPIRIVSGEKECSQPGYDIDAVRKYTSSESGPISIPKREGKKKAHHS